MGFSLGVSESLPGADSCSVGWGWGEALSEILLAPAIWEGTLFPGRCPSSGRIPGRGSRTYNGYQPLAGLLVLSGSISPYKEYQTL